MHYIRLYILSNKLFFLFYTFILFSLISKAFLGIDFTIPCLIKLTTGYECLGCGLTIAASHLLRFEFAQAFEANFLIFLVLPGFFTYLYVDWHSFQVERKIIKAT